MTGTMYEKAISDDCKVGLHLPFLIQHVECGRYASHIRRLLTPKSGNMFVRQRTLYTSTQPKLECSLYEQTQTGFTQLQHSAL
jgi:hypothetical protein